jgi:hypothetical protein
MYSLLDLGKNVHGNWSTGQSNGQPGSVKGLEFSIFHSIIAAVYGTTANPSRHPLPGE